MMNLNKGILTQLTLFMTAMYLAIQFDQAEARCFPAYPWKRPCGPSFIVPDVRPPTTLLSVIIKLREVEYELMVLKAKYSKRPAIKQQILTCWNTGFNHLEKFPAAGTRQKTLSNSSINVSEEIASDFEDISIILVFIEQMQRDEETSLHVGDNFCNLTSKLRGILCDLQIQINNSSLIRTPTRDVMDIEYRLGDRSTKLGRNYLIIKDSLKFVKYMVAKYVRFFLRGGF